MNASEWQRAIESRAAQLERDYENGAKVTPCDVIVIALAHPESYDVFVKSK